MKKTILACAACAVLCLSSCMSNSPKQSLPERELKPKPSTISESSVTVPGLSLVPRKSLDEMLQPVASVSVSDIDLNIPAVFKITRPDNKITTTYSQYFITGTSDPKQPVYFGDTEIDRLGTKGTFGVLVPLELGDNKFTFSQGEKTQTVTVTRKKPVSSESVPISDIRQSSMVPAVFSGVKAGDELDVGCIAPSGASVTATFGGQTVKLSQTDQTKKAGLPAFFKGSITVGESYDEDITGKSGKVNYSMTYSGNTKNYKSTGDVYVAGANSNVAVRVNSYMGFVYPSTSDLSVFREKLKKGAVDYIKSQDNTYVELASGGFAPKEQLSVVEGKVTVRNKLSKIKLSATDKGEAFTFSGTNTPAYLTRLSNGNFSFTLFNTTGDAAAAVSSSKLFSDVEVKSGENYVTYTFNFSNSSKFWGYNVSYKGTSTVLSFNYKPSLSSGSKPFTGLTVVLDPGHGGATGRGALGVAGVTGPIEDDVNLAHAIAAGDLLKSMGANVIITRTEDVYYSLDDRLASSEKLNADLFVSLHHNSIGEDKDANKIQGVEVYYHTPLSKKLAQSMMSSVTKLGRSNRFVSQSYYRVTLSSYAPSVLVELGYMSNPVEYERATSRSQIDKAAQAVADGIYAALS